MVTAVPPVTGIGEQKEELRLGVVMNGGSSLAVWMGGVATEIDRLRLAEGAYGPLLAMLKTEPVVDVISGTSAGAVNGAMLASAIACGTKLEGLSNLWLEKGSFANLFRSPFQSDPPSLLKGEEYFRPALENAFGALIPHKNGGTGEGKDVYLAMTIGLLTPAVTNLPAPSEGTADLDTEPKLTEEGIADDFGSVIPNSSHLGIISFVRNRDKNDWKDHHSDIAKRLALAARSSASFPFAFEASYLPSGPDDAKGFNIREHVNFSHSTYAVDGGTLMNKPFKPALTAIYKQPASGQVRRLLLYVCPDPGGAAPSPADPASPPGIAKTVIDSAITLPRAESVGDELEGIRKHNDSVEALRALRSSLLKFDRNGPLRLISEAKNLHEAFAKREAMASVDRILGDLDTGALSIRTERELDQWDRKRLRKVLNTERLKWLPKEFPPPRKPGGEWRFEKRSPKWTWGIEAVEGLGDTVIDLLSRGLALADDENQRQALGDAKLHVHDVLRVVRRIGEFDRGFWANQASDARLSLLANSHVHPDEAWASKAFQDWINEVGSRCAKIGFAPELGQPSEKGTYEFDLNGKLKNRDAYECLRIAAEEIASILEANADSLKAAAAAAVWAKGDINLANELDDAATTLVDPSARWGTLYRLLALHVVLGVYIAAYPQCDQKIQLMLISGNTPNAFTTTRSVDGKLTGIQLGHFGAFYKDSWRANDWMYGRLDGAWRLTQAMLSPERLRQIFHDQPTAARLVLDAIAKGGDTKRDTPEVADAKKWLAAHGFKELLEAAKADSDLHHYLADNDRGEWRPLDAQNELKKVCDPSQPLPPSLPNCAQGIARRLQLEILMEELPKLRAAVEADMNVRASSTAAPRFRGAWPVGHAVSRGTRRSRRQNWWRRLSRPWKRRSQVAGPTDRSGNAVLLPPPPGEAVAAFQACDVGQETIAGEIGSDLFTSTTTTAAAVMVNAVGGARLKLGPMAAVLGALKSFTLVLYVLAQSAVRRSRSGFVILFTLLALSALVVALPHLDAKHKLPGWLTWGAWTVLLVGFVLAWLRSETQWWKWWDAPLMMAVTVACVVLPFVLIHVPPSPADGTVEGWAAVRSTARPVLSAAALIAVPWMFGYMRRARILHHHASKKRKMASKQEMANKRKEFDSFVTKLKGEKDTAKLLEGIESLVKALRDADIPSQIGADHEPGRNPAAGRWARPGNAGKP
jgi:patatin-related protein